MGYSNATLCKLLIMLNFEGKRQYLLTALFRSKKLRSSEKLVALAMAFKINSDGTSNLTLKELGELCSFTKRTVKKSIVGLEDKIGLNVNRTPAKNHYSFDQWDRL